MGQVLMDSTDPNDRRGPPQFGEPVNTHILRHTTEVHTSHVLPPAAMSLLWSIPTQQNLGQGACWSQEVGGDVCPRTQLQGEVCVPTAPAATSTHRKFVDVSAANTLSNTISLGHWSDSKLLKCQPREETCRGP